MGINHIDDCGTSGGHLGLRSTCFAGCVRRGNGPCGLFLIDKGSAVVSAVVNIALATLITLSVLALILSAHNTLQIRNAVIDAASKAALSEAPNQQRYLLRLLETNLPHLAQYEVDGLASGQFLGLRASTTLPGFGFVFGISDDVIVYGAKESLG